MQNKILKFLGSDKCLDHLELLWRLLPEMEKGSHLTTPFPELSDVPGRTQ